MTPRRLALLACVVSVAALGCSGAPTDRPEPYRGTGRHVGAKCRGTGHEWLACFNADHAADYREKKRHLRHD